MKVSDILRVKGSAIYTVTPSSTLWSAVQIMAEKDIGSVVVIDRGELVGMLTFREVINTLHQNEGKVGDSIVRHVMDEAPLTVSQETEINEVRRLMLDRHVRYLPVMDGRTLIGVISFYDVAKAVLEEQGFENRMLKAYIRDWPEQESVNG
ncbi:MAG TPA: CBS domain-containing protein [Burkholderiaceae bacterium]|nr:CBS domain-containing protein [Burkholderiaceae bacterium]